MRCIQQELFNYINDRLCLQENPVARIAIEEKDARTLFVCALETLMGVREKTGNNDGKMVELIQKTIGIAEHESWCMAFQQSGLAYVEKKLNVISPIFASEHCLTTWNNTSIKQRVKYSPLKGAIVIWQHGETTNGHTGCFYEWLDEDRKTFKAIEGNTSADMSAVKRNGDGVHFTKRPIGRLGDMHIVGCLKPF